jgi:hypothetical protein
VTALTAFYDASVLCPSELRNLLMHLALTGLFQAKWSAALHEEWIGALLRRRPDLAREKLERTRTLMDLHAADACNFPIPMIVMFWPRRFAVGPP